MTNYNAKIIKLSSGEEIICNIVNDVNHPTHVGVKKPMKLNSYPRATQNGIEEALSLQRWIHFAETDTYDIPKTQVIVLTEASYGLTKFYDYCVNKMNNEDDVMVPAPSDEELDEIEQEEWEESFGEPYSKLLH